MVLDQMEADGMIAAFCHFPEPFGKTGPAGGQASLPAHYSRSAAYAGAAVSAKKC